MSTEEDSAHVAARLLREVLAETMDADQCIEAWPQEVAVFSTVDFDATTVVLSTVKLGDPLLTPRVAALTASQEDVNGDGIMDVVFDFGTAKDFGNAGALDGNSTEVLLTGTTTSGQNISGTDQVQVVGGGGGGGGSVALFRRGDSNVDAALDIGDPLFTLNYLFAAGPAPSCEDAADTNDDGKVDLADPVYSLSFLFLGGPAPGQPFHKCGTDLSEDRLTCESAPGCP